MRIIAKRTLRDFWMKHADCEQQLKAWFSETEKAGWTNVNAMKEDHPNASILQNGRIVFNIKGNKYRLVVRFNFDYQLGWVRFIGTHAEYDKTNANTI
ncbi:MAG: type II toxin-antitoxin system HigB family toxin [Flavobacteriales bacterium]